MNNIGDIINGSSINKRVKDKYILQACEKCGTIRWVRLEYGQPRSKICYKCNHGDGHKTWNKYKVVYVPKDSPFRIMANSKRASVREHRLIMAEYLGRPLKAWEIVHHRNGNKEDNKIENLSLVSDDEHKQITILEKYVQLLEEQLSVLIKENDFLRGGGGNR
uniref:Putative homing endonuclease n=1 Tax=viral metagenome TaxID=1070528 RepID=A0A6M3IQ88_9ZZZZ